jgi:hypothetical protein
MNGIPVRDLLHSAPTDDQPEVGSKVSPSVLPGGLIFGYDLLTNTIRWVSGDSLDVLGVDARHLLIHGALFLAHAHPSDRFTTEEMLDLELTVKSLSRPDELPARWLGVEDIDHGLLRPGSSLLDALGSAEREGRTHYRCRINRIKRRGRNRRKTSDA